MKILKRILWITGILIVIVVGSLVAVATLVDSNQYKTQLVDAVEKNTGRKLDFPGELNITFYPWIGFKTGALSLQDAPGFGEQPMLSIENANVQVRLLPLLKKRLEIGEVVLNKPRLNLITRLNGSSNLDDLLSAAPASAQQQSASSSSFTLAGLVVEGVSIRDGNLQVKNEPQKLDFDITGIKLETGEISPGESMDIHLEFKAHGNVLPDSIKLSMDTQISIDHSLNELDISALDTDMTMGKMEYALEVENILFKIRQESLLAKAIRITQSDITLTGNVSGSGLLTQPVLDGNFHLQIPDLAKAMRENGLSDSQDSGIAGVLELESKFRFLNHLLEFNTASIETNLSGADSEIKIPFGQFDLESGNLEIPAVSVEQDDLQLNLSLKAEKLSGDPQSILASGDVDLQISNLDGVMSNNQLQDAVPAGLFKKANIKTDFSVAMGGVTLPDLEGSLDNTAFKGSASLLNLLTEPPTTLEIQQSITNIDLYQVLSALEITSKFEGKGDLQIDLANILLESEFPANEAEGEMGFRLFDGAIKGFDLQAALLKVNAALSAADSENHNQSYQPDMQTRFTELTGSFKGRSGKFQSNDISMKAPAIRLAGNGGVDLADEMLDFDFDITIVNTVEGQGGENLNNLEGVDIPFKVKGSFSEPGFRLNYKKLLNRQVKKEVKEKLEDSLKEKLGNKLKLNLGG